jgi:hypothetical protein
VEWVADLAWNRWPKSVEYAQICALRSYSRQRDTLVRGAATQIQHMQKCHKA